MTTKLKDVLQEATGKSAYAGDAAEEGVDVETNEGAVESDRTMAAV